MAVEFSRRPYSIWNALLTRTPGSAVIGFVLCTLPSIHYHVLLAATACFGATALILGVDCYTTAGLKEVGHRVRPSQFVINPCVVLRLQPWLRFPLPQVCKH